MTHRLAETTRTVAFAAAGTAVVAVADLLDRQGPTASVLLASIGLLVGAFVLARTRQVALTVTDDRVVVQGLLTSRTFDVEDVVGVTSTHWNSFVELRDGRSVMTLLRQDDLAALSLPASPTVTQMTVSRSADLVTA